LERGKCKGFGMEDLGVLLNLEIQGPWMLNIKQEALAYHLGNDWNQKKISMLVQKNVIEDSLLKQISSVLRIPVEAFQNFDEEQWNKYYF